jgi:hypothetical protein
MLESAGLSVTRVKSQLDESLPRKVYSKRTSMDRSKTPLMHFNKAQKPRLENTPSQISSREPEIETKIPWTTKLAPLNGQNSDY